MEQELIGPITYRLPKITFSAIIGGFAYILTGNKKYLTRNGWIEVINVVCE